MTVWLYRSARFKRHFVKPASHTRRVHPVCNRRISQSGAASPIEDHRQDDLEAICSIAAFKRLMVVHCSGMRSIDQLQRLAASSSATSFKQKARIAGFKSVLVIASIELPGLYRDLSSRY